MTKQMVCPACGGKGYRDLRIGPLEGICPTCGGAGSVKEEAKEGSWVYNYVPCKDCGGRGVKPVANGGKRDELGDVVLASGGGMDRGQWQDTGTESVDTDSEAEAETKPADDRSFFSKYQWYFIGGGGALLVLALIAMQSSKKHPTR